MSNETKEELLDHDVEPTEICATCDDRRIRSDMIYHEEEDRWFCADGCFQNLGLIRCENCGVTYSAEFKNKCPGCGYKTAVRADGND